jgi:hypothetical protein
VNIDIDHGFRTRRLNVQAALSLAVKRWGERLSWWLWPGNR